MALPLIKTAWRKKCGVAFFGFSLFLAVHTLPTALMGDSAFTYILFTFTSVWVRASAIWGLSTLKNYDNYPVKAEKHLLSEYSLITLGAYGASFVECFGIAPKFSSKFENGYFPDFGTVPHYRQAPPKDFLFLFFPPWRNSTRGHGWQGLFSSH
jgi:hypothetical protein